MQRYLSDLLEIERLVHAKRGDRFSTELWGESQFLSEQPGKFEISYGVLKGDKLTSYLICSVPLPGTCHVHRVAVHPKFAGDNDGRKLMYKAYQDWKNMPQYTKITAITRQDHKLTLPFAKLLGARAADKALMTQHFESLGKTDVQIFDEHFEDVYGIRYVLIYIEK